MLYNGIQKLNNNWKANQSNSIKVLFNGLKRDKNKLPSKVKYINKNNIDVSTIEINNIFHVQYYTPKGLNSKQYFAICIYIMYIYC